SAGLRFWKVDRAVLPREVVKVEISCGPVSVKRWRMPSGNWRIKVEFDDVMKLSKRTGIRPERLRDEAVAAYYSEYGDGQEKD
ncbi:MAG: nickel insertion protein, partial [bacterium]